MKTNLKDQPIRQTVKTAKVKRNLNNADLKKHFGKDRTDVWAKDIYTGEGSFDF